jgi:hypothetical protein
LEEKLIHFIMQIGIITTKLTNIPSLLAAVFFILVYSGPSRADPSSSETDLLFYEEFLGKVETGLTDPVGFHYYWKEGLHLDSPKKRLKVGIFGRILADAGYIGANEVLQSSFPTFEGWNARFRDLRITLLSTLYDDIVFKFAMDFANIRDIKDIWIGYRKTPFLGRVRAGHFKEPFSLEQQTSIANLSFMERALPVQTLSRAVT